MLTRWKPALALAGSVLVASVQAFGQSASSSPGAAAPSTAPTTSSPRAWPIVVGSLIFVPTYGATIYWALSGDATSYGVVRSGESRGEHDFGKPGLLFIPVLGPLIFDASFCSDAKEYYEKHPGDDEPRDACSGAFWSIDAAIQALGAAFIVAGFLNPVEHPSRTSMRVVLTPFAQTSSVGMSARGSF